MTDQFPEVLDALGGLPTCVLDAELVVLDSTGHAIWDRVRARAVMRQPWSISRTALDQTGNALCLRPAIGTQPRLASAAPCGAQGEASHAATESPAPALR